MNPEMKRERDARSKEPVIDQKEIDRVSMYNQRFRKARDAYRKRRESWKIIDMFDRGEQWADVNLPPWIPKPVHNLVKYIRIIKRANLAGNISAAHYSPINPEHRQEVDMLQKGYKHVWATQKVPYTIRRCIDRALLQGTAIAYVYSDDTAINGEYYTEGDKRNKLWQGEIYVKRFPNTNFFPDPDAFCIEECKWIETTELTTLSAVKANKKFQEYAGDKLKNYKASGSAGNSEDAGTDAYIREEDPASSSPVTPKDESVTVHTHWEMIYDDKGKRKLNVSYYIGESKFELLRIEDVKPCVFPFAVYYDEEEDQDFWGSSTAMDIIEKQKLINKTEQAVSILGTLHQNPQKIVARESGINGKEMARMGNMPGKTWTTNVDPTRSVYVIQPPDIPRGLFDIKDRSVGDIKDYAGLNEAYTGDSVGSLTTSTGVNSLIERSTIRDRDKMKQIDVFVESISDLIVMFILEKWKDKRNIINTGQAGKVEQYSWEPIKSDVANNLQWFVRSDVYATAPITQALRKQQADQLMQMQMQFQMNPPIITITEWLDMQDFDNKDEIRRRMEDDQQKLDEQKAQDLAGIVLQMADQARQLIGQGVAQPQVQQQITEQVQQILDQQEQQRLLSGIPVQEGRKRDAATNANPNTNGSVGSTGQTAMMAQARGI